MTSPLTVIIWVNHHFHQFFIKIIPQSKKPIIHRIVTLKVSPKVWRKESRWWISSRPGCKLLRQSSDNIIRNNNIIKCSSFLIIPRNSFDYVCMLATNISNRITRKKMLKLSCLRLVYLFVSSLTRKQSKWVSGENGTCLSTLIYLIKDKSQSVWAGNTRYSSTVI